MPDTLPVHVNRGELHALEVPATFETDDSFVVELTNHGEASRVHVHLDDGLSNVASVDDTNHYVEARGVQEVPVSVNEAGPIRGKIKVVTGYGATTRWIDVVITESEEETRSVVVDEELAKPQPRDDPDSGSTLDGLADNPTLPILALAGVALVVAVAAAATTGNGLVLAGAGVVVLAVIVGVAFALR